MANGSLVEEGDHDSLMAKGGEYKRIYDAQENLEGAFTNAK